MNDAPPKRVIGRPFPKGVSGNPKGVSSKVRAMAHARTMTATQFTEIAVKYLHKTKEEVMEAENDPTTPAIELIVASILSKAIVHGDQTRLNFLVERIMGKVPNELKIDTSGLSDEDLQSKLQEALVYLKSNKSEGQDEQQKDTDGQARSKAE